MSKHGIGGFDTLLAKYARSYLTTNYALILCVLCGKKNL